MLLRSLNWKIPLEFQMPVDWHCFAPAPPPVPTPPPPGKLMFVVGDTQTPQVAAKHGFGEEGAKPLARFVNDMSI